MRWRDLRRDAFWGGVPLAFAALLFWPRSSVLFVGDGLELSPVVSLAPRPFDAVAYHYPGTLWALALLAVAVVRSRRPLTLSTCFLPTLVAGLESAGVLAWHLRCHAVTDPSSLGQVVLDGLWLSSCTLCATIVACAVAARAAGHRCAVPVPPVAVGVLASAVLPWWLLSYLG